MRYLILLALLMCLPVQGEAWQVVGGGGASTFCSAYPTAFFCEDFSTDTTSTWNNVREANSAWLSVSHDTTIATTGSMKLVADGDSTYNDLNKINPPDFLPQTYNYQFKVYVPCSGGVSNNLRVNFGGVAVYRAKPTCGSWVTISGSLSSIGTNIMTFNNDYNLVNGICYVRDILITVP